jgi:hypothetical protein
MADMSPAEIPNAPRIYSTEEELADELNRRIDEVKTGNSPTFDASETMRRARKAIARIRREQEKPQ